MKPLLVEESNDLMDKFLDALILWSQGIIFLKGVMGMTENTGYLKKSYHKSLHSENVEGKWINDKIEELRRLGYSDEYINKELGHLVNWRI